MNKISVIVPVYKVEKYLDRCVESLVNQTYKNLEIILVDDGSPDNCPKMCDEWAEKDSRIKVIHKENGGLSDARNKGIEKSTGDYIMFVDSDDYISLDICQRLLNLLVVNNADMSICDVLTFNEDESLKKKNKKTSVKVLDKNEIIKQLYKTKIKFLMTAWAKLYKKYIFDNIKYPKGRLHEDEFIIHEILCKLNRIAYTNEKMYYYMQRKSSITSTKKQKNIEDLLDAFETRYEFLCKNFPEYSNKNNLRYMDCLRAVYLLKYWADKSLKKHILTIYRKLYKETRNKGVLHLAFYCFPNLMLFIVKKN